MTNAPTTSRELRAPMNASAQELAAWLQQRVRESRRAKIRYLSEWYQNLAFFMGKQWVNWDWTTLQIRDVANPQKQLLPVENMTRPLCQSVVALMQSAQPQINVVPDTAEIEDQQASEVSQVNLDYADRVTNWEMLKWDRDIARVVWGTVAVRHWMDPHAGETVQGMAPNPATGQPEMAQWNEGEVRTEVYSPLDFEVFPVNAKSNRHVKAICFHAYRPVEELREEYPEFAKQIQESPDETDIEDYHRRRIETLTMPAAFGPSDGRRRGMARVYEYLEAPTRKNPQGRKICMVNNLIVYAGPNEIADKFPLEAPDYLKLGVVFYHFMQNPDTFWGCGAVDDLRPLQIRLNKLIAALMRNRLALGNNKVLIPTGAIPNEAELTNEHGAKIHYNWKAGMPPVTIVPATPLDSQIFAEIGEIKQAMFEIVMRPQAVRGINPTQTRSAEQLAQLQEAGNQPFAPIARNTEQGDGDCARIKLVFTKHYYSDVKVMRIQGAQRGFAPFVVRRQNLYTDVTVVAGSALPRNRYVWNRMLADFAQLGVFTKPDGSPDLDWLKENIDLGGYQFERREQVDIDRQDTENVALANGQWVGINPWDNHIVHIERADLYLKKHPQLPPPFQQALMMHQQQHIMALSMTALPPPGAPVMPMQGMAQQPQPARPAPAPRQPMEMSR